MQNSLRFLLIDDDTVFAEHLRTYAKLSNWQVEHLSGDSESYEKLPQLLVTFKPQLILLDVKLKNNNQDIVDWLESLKTHKYLSKTTVITGYAESEYKYITDHYEIKSTLTKPIKLSLLDDLIRKETYLEKVIDFYEKLSLIKNWLNNINLAISIHYITLDNLSYKDPVWYNTTYSKHPIKTVDDQRTLLLMIDQLNKNEQDSAHQEEFDGTNEQWIYAKLYKIDTDLFWYTREYASTEEKPHFFDKTSFNELLVKLYQLLNRWGITRLRFYKAYVIYDNHYSTHNYIFEPTMQIGDGFKDRCTEQNWINNKIITISSEDTKIAFENNPSKNWYFSASKNDNTEPIGCSEVVGWGNSDVDRIIIPIEQIKDNKDPEPFGLLAFDRRYDHLLEKNNEQLEAISWWKIIFNEAGGANDNPALICSDELNRLKGVLLEFRDEILQRRQELKTNQIALWHEAISQTIRYTLTTLHQRQEDKFDDVLELFIKKLITYWDYINDEPEGNSLPSDDKLKISKSLISWYFLKEEIAGSLIGMGGFGQLASHYQHRILRAVEPFTLVDTNKTMNLGIYSIQNFQQWIRDENHYQSKHIEQQCTIDANYINYLKEIGSWCGIPISVAGKNYLMIVHAKEKHYFTTRRTKLLRTASLRLSPFLLWVDAVASKNALFKSINHELKSPLDVAKQALQLNNLELAMNNLKLLVMTTNNIWYLAHQGQNKSQSTISNLDKLEEIINIAQVPYTLKQKQVDIQQGYKNYIFAVPEDVLIQILYNLLSNAFKFSGKKLDFHNIKMTYTIIENNMRLVISNPIDENRLMTSHEREWIFTLGYKKDSTGSGTGLAIVNQLCKQFNISCRAEEPEELTGHIYYQPFSLTIPLATEAKHEEKIILD